MPKHKVLSLLLAAVISLLCEGSLQLVHPENVVITCRVAGNRMVSCAVSISQADVSAVALLSCTLLVACQWQICMPAGRGPRV